MLNFLPGVIRGVLSFLMITLNTVMICTFIFIMACLKLAIPAKSWRSVCDRILIFMATAWVRNNILISQLMHQINWAPISVMNFMEGTRFTSAKHARQKSPHTHLLRPKAGGVAFVLGAMGDHLTCIADVTIVYPDGVKNIWEFLCGKVPLIKVRVETMPITQEFQGDYFGDKKYRISIQRWVNTLWCKKDLAIKELLRSGIK